MLDILTYSYYGNTVQQYLIFASVLLVSMLISKVADHILKHFLNKLVSKTKTKFDDILFDSFSGPLMLFIIIIGLYFGQYSLTLSETITRIYTSLLRIGLQICVAWFFVRVIDAIIVHYIAPLTARTETDLDDHLLPFLRTGVKTAILIILIIMLLSELGFNVTAIIASLGIGGIALGLAAKDFAANLFGGFVLIIDRPFKVGDKISIGADKGRVRNITLRFTELEHEDGTKLIIPNSKFVGTTINNLSFKYKK